jgi:GntR family transcriptional regulator / MocR family aminotransferase
VPRHPVNLPPSVLPLAGEDGRPLRWRLHQGLKAAILAGQLGPGARLPSSRALAQSLRVSRSTVVEAFDQLVAEGLLEQRRGSGTYVSKRLAALPAAGLARRRGTATARRRRAQRAPEPAAVPTDWPGGPPPFTPCEPDADLFPHHTWARMLARHARTPGPLTTASMPAGLPRLRTALAAHLTWSRGVIASPEQVIVVSGALQALQLCTYALLDPGDRVWFEDPGYPAARAGLRLAGLRLVPVPVDSDGVDVQAGRRLAPDARAAYVTPSHQFPTGAILGFDRRLQLLEWAAEQDAWIFEDDYDSEFNYAGHRPLPALQGLDGQQSVVYIGTLNKITFRGLRVAYLVVPESACEAVTATAAVMSLSPPAVVQAAAADFIGDGHLAQHITRTRTVYRERHEFVVEQFARHLGEYVHLEPQRVGMHVLARLRQASATEVAGRAAGRGLDLRTLDSYAEAGGNPDTLVIGYTHLTPARCRVAVRDFATIVTDLARRPRRGPTRGGAG